MKGEDVVLGIIIVIILFVCGFVGVDLGRAEMQRQAVERGYGKYLPDKTFEWNKEAP